MADSTSRPSLYEPDARTKTRNAAEKRFRIYGLVAVALGVAALLVLLFSVLGTGLGAFRQTVLTVPVTLEAAKIDPKGNRDPAEIAKATTVTYGKLIATALQAAVAEQGLAPADISAKDIGGLISKEAPAALRDKVLANPDLIGQTISYDVLASGRIDGFFKGRVTMDSAKLDSNVTPEQLQLAQNLREAGMLKLAFNPAFLTNPDASELRPESAGLGVAMLGSAYMMAIVLFLALPIGVAASIYLEEFAPKNRFTDLIEVNIANLAAVPSIVYGILGLAAFINFGGGTLGIENLAPSAPLVGGLVLTLMTLPRIIIPTRAALGAVPPSIREAALGVGASKTQTIFHHVLPLAVPGILTGAIIGLAQALGETAPLLLIGMVAFVKDYPAVWSPDAGLLGDPASAIPVQIYNWTQRSDPAFVERASGAIIVLLIFLMVMNSIAIILRRKFERRW